MTPSWSPPLGCGTLDFGGRPRTVVICRQSGYQTINLRSSFRYDIHMAQFKFMLDRGVNHLVDCFPHKRVVSTETLGLDSQLPDDGVVAYASEKVISLWRRTGGTLSGMLNGTSPNLPRNRMAAAEYRG
jgi:hypothetical protein